MKVAVFSTKPYDKEYLDKVNTDSLHEFTYFESSLKEKTARLAENHEAVCVFVNDKLNNDVIEQLASLKIKLIALRCAGFNNVDVESANKNQMKVLRVPAYSPYAVAEHAVALILTLNRKTHKAYNRVREGNFSLIRLTGFDLYGKTVGVIGTGKIGTVFANIMKGFGCNVVAFDQFPNKTLIQAGVSYLKMDELLNVSDIISLHCPLNPATNHMINYDSIRKMKEGVMLINTSRGKLIDTDAVIEGLKQGRIGYLGIDVYEQEETLFYKDLSEMVILDDKIARLMSFPNVLITAHQAFFTDNALQQISMVTLKNLTDFENGTITMENLVSIDMIK